MGRLCVLVGLVPLLMLFGFGRPVVGAQDGTPSTGRVVVDVCAVEPRPTDELLAIWYDAEGTPVATPLPPAPVGSAADLPAGSAADPPDIVGMSAAAQEWVACFNNGDFARYYALLTDDLVRQQGPEPGESPAEARAFLEEAPEAVPDEERLSISAARDPRSLPDGRFGALFALDYSAGGSVDLFIVFERGDDRFLLAEIIEVGAADGTPVARTPASETLLPISAVDVRVLDSNPAQVEAVVQGDLADSCTEVGLITQERQGATITVTILVTRPADAVCAAVITSVEQTIPLDGEFPPGEYTLQVNDQTVTFTV